VSIPKTPRELALARVKSVERESEPWRQVWRELAIHFLPGSCQLTPGDRRIVALPDDIVSSKGYLAREVMSSGMSSGLTSPARPWFNLSLGDPDTSKVGPVQVWLHHFQEAMMRVFQRSNTYQTLPVLYQMLATHGTAVLWIDEDQEDVVRSYVFPMGTFALAASPRLDVDTIVRRVQMTVSQVVGTFGYDVCSQRTQKAFDQELYEEWVDVIHLTEPNRERDPEKADSAGMKYISRWLEQGSDKECFLREKGYRERPFCAIRWDIHGNQVYGRGPGFYSLADSRQLQWAEKEKARLIELLASPPLAVPSNIAGYPLPGDLVRVTHGGQQNMIQPIQLIPPAAIQVMQSEIDRLEDRINDAWKVRLWLSITEDERAQRATAREVQERSEEKMLQLGPVLVRIQNEGLDPLIERVAAIMFRRGLVEQPPEELHGHTVRVEYVSQMALAQRLAGIASIERLLSTTGSIAAMQPNVLDKINLDKLIETYAERLTADPDIMVPQDKVDEVRSQRAAAAQQNQQITEQAPAVAGVAKTLSETDVGGDNALNRLYREVAGGSAMPSQFPTSGGGGAR
jgi:hypothetical protein